MASALVKCEYSAEESSPSVKCESPAENSVDNLLQLINENALDYDLKVYFKSLRPPRPALHIEQVEWNKKDNKSFTRKFRKSLYESDAWICGCDVRNAVFCYVCMIINSNGDPAWVSRGVADLKHLSEKVKKHRLSEKHMNNRVEFSMLGKISIVSQLDGAYRADVKLHNENVRKNRRVLNELIDAIKFCRSFEAALKEREPPATPENRGPFHGPISLTSEIDYVLKERLAKSNNETFAALSPTIQSELLDSIYAVSLDLIHKEIEQSDYVAIQIEETADCTASSQMAFIVRYELKGQVHERFMGFLVPETRRPDAIAKMVLNELQKLKIDQTPGKLIAQSYGGATATSHSVRLQDQIKEVYRNAHYIHCYAHQLTSIVQRAACQNKQVRAFFSNLEGFATFFARSPKRVAVLDDVVKRRPPEAAKTRWNFKARCVATVCTYKSDIADCLERIIDDETTDNATLRKATGLRSALRDCDFDFWLGFFNKIMPCCEHLHNQLRQPECDAVKVQTCMKTFKSAIQHVRTAVDCEGGEEVNGDEARPAWKRPRYEDQDLKKAAAKDVCDVILSSVGDRFEFTDHLAAAALFQPHLFSKHKLMFPAEELKIAARAFGVDEKSLKHELVVIYNRHDFGGAAGALVLLQFLNENDLSDVFPESVKLLKIVCTMPMATSEGERCFSTLERVETFARGTTREDGLSALAMCSIEKGLLRDTPDFNALVIDHFARQKRRRIDLLFKNIN